MTKTTALLLLGAIMLIVAGLVGKDGTVANVAAMDQDRLAAAINERDADDSGPQPWSPGTSGQVDSPVIVTPTIAEDTATFEDDEVTEELPVEDIGVPTAESDGINLEAFDPRIR